MLFCSNNALWMLTWQCVSCLCICIPCVYCCWVWSCYFVLSILCGCWREFNQGVSCAYVYPVYWCWVWSCYFVLSILCGCWREFNQGVSCAYAYPVYWCWVWSCYFVLSMLCGCWCGFNQQVSCAHAYSVYWCCLIMLFCFNNYALRMLMWVQPGSKLCPCIPCVLMLSLIMLFCFINALWMLTWIQAGCKLCKQFVFIWVVWYTYSTVLLCQNV